MDNGDFAARLDLLESRIAIERLSNEYAHGFDTADLEMVRGIWFEDSRLLMGEPYGDYHGIEEILAGTQNFFEITPAMHHFMANPLIDIDGDKAHADYALDCFCTSGEMGPIHIGGFYRDDLERRDGRWGIVTRVFELSFLTPISNWTPKFGSESATATPA
jgi:SnoaL-like domain